MRAWAVADVSACKREGNARGMRPKLKEDTFYIPVSDGIYLRNNRGPFTIKGKVVYRWLERLAPYLNGQYTLEEITQGLPEEKKSMINDLVTLLLVNGFIKDLTDDHPHTLSAAEERLYAPEIAFIDSFVNSAAHRFEQFRQSRMLLIGSGLSFTALVHANLRSGVQQLAVLTTNECFTSQQQYYQYLDECNQRGSCQSLIDVRSARWSEETEVGVTIQPFDVVIAVSDLPMLARARMLNKLCRALGKTLIQAVIVDHHAWVGPSMHAETSGCWECAWLRLQAHLSDVSKELPLYAFQDHPDTPTSRCIAVPTATVVANQLSFEIFKYLTGAGHLETEAHLLSIDLETLEVEKHPFLPHPLCTACHPPTVPTAELFHTTLHHLEQGSPIDQETFAKHATICFESHLGLFTSITEDDFIQLPLNISQVTVSNPMLLPHLNEPIVVTGVGTDVSIARRRATQRACEIYAASIVDQRQLLQPNHVQRVQCVKQMEWLTLEKGLDAGEHWTWARNLHTAQTCLVPASFIYPGLRGVIPSDTTTPGLASGLSYAEAISRALLSYCKYLTLRDIAMAQKPFAQVKLEALSLSAEGARYRHLVELLGETIAIYDVTGPLQVPTFAFCLGDTTLAYSSHLDISEAIHDGLEQILQHYQSITNDQLQYALGVVSNLLTDLRGTDITLPEYKALPDWPTRQSYLQDVLYTRGWRAFVAPLHPDPALTSILPYIVHVLLAHT